MYHDKRIDFIITRRCLNKCVFCSESDMMNNSEVSLAEAKETLRRERRAGAGLVHLVGGEPTVHRNFFEIAKYAKEIGYKVFIITNAIMFADEKFAKKVLPFIDELMVSIHGHDKNSHDKNTNNNGAFEKLIAGLKNIKNNFTGRLEATTAITVYNYKTLIEIAKLVKECDIREYQCMTIVPTGQGCADYEKINPSLSMIKSHIEKVIDYCDRNNISVRFSGVPMCVLGKNFAHSHDLWENVKLGDNQDSDIRLWQEPGKEKDFLVDMGRIKTKKCNKCLYAEICGGIYKKYYEIFGDDEINPFI